MEEKDFMVGVFVEDGFFKYKIINNKYNLSMNSLKKYKSINQAEMFGQAELKNLFNKSSKQKFLKLCRDKTISTKLTNSFSFLSIKKELLSFNKEKTIKEILEKEPIDETSRSLITAWLFKEDLFLQTTIEELSK